MNSVAARSSVYYGGAPSPSTPRADAFRVATQVSRRTMPHRSTSPTPAASALALVRVEELELSSETIPPVRRRDPYAIERMPCAPGWVHIIGYNGRGEYMTEWRLPARLWTEHSTSRYRRWLEQNDDTPTPSLLTAK